MRSIKISIRSIALLCIIALLTGTLFSCSDSDNLREGRPLVVATIFPPYDFARNIAGDHAEVELLVDVTDSHSYSPTAADMLLIEECDVFIYTGGEGDRWAEDFLDTIDLGDKVVINMLETVDFLLEESDESHHDHEHEHDHGHAHEHSDETLYDEHVWLSPINAKCIASAICDALSVVDPDHAASYQEGIEQYADALDSLDADLQATVASAKRKTLLVADRFPFRYLCEQYGLSYHAALPGCSSAADLTAVEYEHLAEQLKENDLPVVFIAEYSDGTIARTIVRESGCEDVSILTLHSCHTMTRGQIAEGKSYLSLMRENIDALKKALN